MMTVRNVTKRFDNKTALSDVSLNIDSACVYGLVGTNGSGKSTLLRLMSGVYSANDGSIEIDGSPVFENPDVKQNVFFVSDDLWFHPQASLESSAAFYRAVYPSWNEARYDHLCELFPIGKNGRLATYSKGMRRQAALILALSCSPQYLLLDEAFDGLDPVIRFAVRKIISDMISEYGMTVVISSHNLRELEDFCDRVGLLHQGQMMLECDMDEIRIGFTKVQAVLRPMPEKIEIPNVRVLSQSVSGSVVTIVVQSGEQEALSAVAALSPMLCEAVPLTLEEVFIYEMEAVGYDYTKIIF